MLRIRFHGKDFVFVGDTLSDDGAIFSDGKIERFHENIGSREDIEVIGTYEQGDDFDASAQLAGILTDPSWPPI